jgi:hypothetical protein
LIERAAKPNPERIAKTDIKGRTPSKKTKGVFIDHVSEQWQSENISAVMAADGVMPDESHSDMFPQETIGAAPETHSTHSRAPKAAPV